MDCKLIEIEDFFINVKSEECRIINMRKVNLSLEVDDGLYMTLQEIARSLDIQSVEALLEQEFDRILCDIVAWLERVNRVLNVKSTSSKG